jgi:hypothetical protein
VAGPGPTLSRRKEIGSTELRWAEVDPEETDSDPKSGRTGAVPPCGSMHVVVGTRAACFNATLPSAPARHHAIV